MSTHEEAAAMSSDAPSPQTPTETARQRHAEADAEAADPVGCLEDIPAGRRTSGNMELLVIEAELAADGVDLDNPAVPANEVFEDVLEELERKDLDPAWIVCREGWE
jgi:hypothetical protein